MKLTFCNTKFFFPYQTAIKIILIMIIIYVTFEFKHRVFALSQYTLFY